MNPKEWQTADTCWSCRHDGMTFRLEEIIRVGLQMVYFGTLECPECRSRQEATCFDYQVPAAVTA